MTFTNEDKAMLLRLIKNCGYKKYVKVLKHIINNDIPFTKNENGVFFNLNALTDDELLSVLNIVTTPDKKKLNKIIDIDKTYLSLADLSLLNVSDSDNSSTSSS
jgi:hypothetical protein